MSNSITPASAFTDALAEWAELLPTLEAMAPSITQLGEAMVKCWRGGGKVMFAGNGGSAADAMHCAEELVVRFHKNRRALAALALLDATALTCAGNDLGYEEVFARQVDALGKPGDLFCGLTTSGSSPNILRAMDVCRERGVKTVAFIGKTGGMLRGACDIELLVPSDSTARIQEAHMFIFHALCVWIDEVAASI